MHVARQVLVLHDDVAALAVLADDPAEHRRRVRAPGETGGVVGAVQRGAGVVAHAAVDGHVRAGRGRLGHGRVELQRHGLDRADGVERDAGGADDVPTGFHRDLGHRDPAFRAGLGDDRGEGLGDVLGRERRVGLGVVDAPSSAEVELRHRPRGHERCVHVHEAPGGLAEAGLVEDLRADVRVQADEREGGLRADRRRGLLGLGQRDAELLVLAGGGEVLVRGGVHAAVDPDADALHDTGVGGGPGDALHLLVAVEDDRADPDLDGAGDLGVGLVVAVEAEHPRVDTAGQGDRELPAGADVDAEVRLGHPRGDLGRQERLAGVVDVRTGADPAERVREGGPHAHGSGLHVALVDHVEGCAELPGEVRGGDPAHGELAVVRPGRGRGPDARRQRGGVRREPQPRRGKGVLAHGTRSYRAVRSLPSGVTSRTPRTAAPPR